MFKTLSERETEMDCGFICLTDKYLIYSKIWKIKTNKLKLYVNHLVLRMKIFGHWKNLNVLWWIEQQTDIKDNKTTQSPDVKRGCISDQKQVKGVLWFPLWKRN